MANLSDPVTFRLVKEQLRAKGYKDTQIDSALGTFVAREQAPRAVEAGLATPQQAFAASGGLTTPGSAQALAGLKESTKPEGEKERLFSQSAESAVKALNTFRGGEVETGPLTTRIQRLKQTLPGAEATEGTRFRSQLSAMRTQIRNALLGGAISVGEAKSLEEALPNATDQEAIIEQKLETFIDTFGSKFGITPDGLEEAPPELGAEPDQGFRSAPDLTGIATTEPLGEEPSALETQQDTSLADLPGNILPSLFKNTADIANVFLHPIDTAKGITGLGAGIVQKFIPGEQDQEVFVDGLINFYKDRYGSLENAKSTIINDPVGVLLDVGTVLEGGGLALRGVGVVSKGTKVAKVGRALDPVGVIARGTNAGIAKLSIKGFNKIDDIATDLPLKGVSVSPTKQVDFAQTTKMTMPEFIRKNKLGGDPIGKATDLLDSKNKQFSEIANRTDVFVDNQRIISGFDEQITNLRSGANANIPQMGQMADRLDEFKQTFITNNGADGQTALKNLTDTRKGIDTTIRGKNAFNVSPDVAGASVQSRRVYQDAIVEGAQQIPNGDVLRGLGLELRDLNTFVDFTRRTETSVAKGRLLNTLRAGYAGGTLVTGNFPALFAGIVFDQLAQNPTALGVASRVGQKGARIGKTAVGAGKQVLPELETLGRRAEFITPNR